MKKRSVVVGLAVISVLFFAGCENPSSSSSSSSGGSSGDDGTFTVTVSGLDASLSDTLVFAIVPAGATVTESNLVAMCWLDHNEPAGTDTCVAIPPEGGEDWVGTGGTTYDAYIFLDVDDDVGEGPVAGDYKYKDWPLRYTQDGNREIATTFDDYTQIE